MDYLEYGLTIEPDCHDHLIKTLLVQLFFASGLALLFFDVGLWFGLNGVTAALGITRISDPTLIMIKNFNNITGVYSGFVFLIWILSDNGFKKYL